MKKVIKIVKPFIFFACLYFLWAVYTIFFTTPIFNEQLGQEDLSTSSALILFAITGSLIIFLLYKIFRFFSNKRKKQTNPKD